MRLSLQPAPHGIPARPTTAWLFPSADSTAVVAELTRHGIDVAEARVVPLPIGLFVMPAATAPLGPAGGAISFGHLAGNVLAPVDALPNAAIAANEWEEIFPPETTFVWHPTAGVYGIAAGEGLRVADLLLPPTVEERRWDRAVPGIAFNGRIVELVPERPPTAAEIWGEAAAEIGVGAPSLSSLPRYPGEWTLPGAAGLSPRSRAIPIVVVLLLAVAVVGWWSGFGRATSGGGGFALPGIPWGGLLILLGLVALVMVAARLTARGEVTPTADGGSMEGPLRPAREQPQGPELASWGAPPRWLHHWQQSLAQAFESRHEREIRRLLHLLETDPDAGLRFAVPLSGQAGRGIVPPAAGLSEQAVDFGSRASGPAAFFVVSSLQREALARRYHELANREIGLGRHRRAASIFAKLLGDHAKAARTLLDGGHFRAAATLYAEKLGRPQEAAEAYERGGLLSEAIALHERLGDHEKVGDLATRLGLEEQAAAAYRRAVEARLEAGDVLGAARILEEKLGAVDEALDRLVGGWPDSPQAEGCVTEALRRLGRLGRHGAARGLVRRMACEGHLDADAAKKVIGILPSFARQYPDEATRRLIADQTRLLAADVLVTAKEDGLAPIMKALRSLEPGDRLLDRDTRRYGRERQQKPAGRRQAELLNPREMVRLTAGTWTTLAGAGESLIVAGRVGRQLTVARCLPGRGVQYATNKSWFAGGFDDDWAARHPCLLAVSERLGRVVVQMSLGFAITERETLPAFHDQGPLVVGSHPAFATEGQLPYVAGMAFTDSSTFDLLRGRVDQDRQADWIRERYDAATDTLLGSWSLPRGDIREAYLPTAAFLEDWLYAASGEELVVQVAGGTSWKRWMPQSVIRLCPSSHDRHSVALSFAEGARVIRWNPSEETPGRQFGAGLEAPHCCFLAVDLVVAAAKGIVEIHDISRRSSTCLATHRDATLDPVAIAPFGSGTPSAGFAVLGACGGLFLFDVRLPYPLFQAIVMADLPSVPIDPTAFDP